MKVATDITKTHNPFDEDYWASCLRENLTSSSYGEGLETGREFTQVPRQSFTRQEDYKVMKCRIEIENFTGKSVLSVYQDFHARIFSKNLTAIMTFPARLEIEQKNQDKRYSSQLNFTQAISKMKDTIVLLFNRPLEIVKNLISALHVLFVKTVEPVRPNRKFPRNHKIQKRGFYPSYKPTR